MRVEARDSLGEPLTARVVIDRESAGSTPLSIALETGAHEVVVSNGAASRSKRLHVAAGETARASFLFPAKQPHIAPVPSSEVKTVRSGSDTGNKERPALPWVLAGLGAATAVGGLVTALVGVNQKSDVESSSSMSHADAAAQWDSADSLETTGFVLLGVGGAMAVGGVIWGATTLGGKETRITVVPSNSGAYFGFTGTF